MRVLAILVLHLLTTIARLVGPGGARSMVVESVLVKHQLLILSRSRKRAPTLCLSDRTIAGPCALLIRPRRLMRSAIVFKPSTFLRLHRALTMRKYGPTVLVESGEESGPEGTHPRSDGRGRPHETAKSGVEVSTDRSANHCRALRPV